MLRGDHTAMQSPPYSGKQSIQSRLSSLSVSIFTVGKEYFPEDLMDLEEPMT